MSETASPYKILALGSFAPVPDTKFKPQFVYIDLYSIDDAVNSIAPVLYMPMPVELCSEGALTLKFNKIKDFKPDSIIKNNAFLNSISENRSEVTLKAHETDHKTIKQKSDTVDDILSMVSVSDSSSFENISGDKPVGKEINNILKEVFLNADFRKTESAWRGLQTLVKQAQIKGFEKISVTIAPVSHNSLEHVLNEAESFSIDKLPNLILIDLDFDNTTPSIILLEKIIQFIDKMMIPACINLKPDFFRIDDFNKIDKLSYINHLLEDISYAKFRKLRELSGASLLIANCNSFAVRAACEFETQPLSASAVWATGILCAKAVNETGWPMDFSKYTKYRVDDLPMFSPDDTNTASSRALFSDERIIQLVEAGITPVAGARNKDFVFIPKQAALSGDSIKFQMFFNRIIESLIAAKAHNNSILNPEEIIKKALSDIFTRTGHNEPETIFVKKDEKGQQDQDIFLISFTPPASVLAVTDMIEFSFVW